MWKNGFLACSSTMVQDQFRHRYEGYFFAQAIVCRNSDNNIIQMIFQIRAPCPPNIGEALDAQLAASLAVFLQIGCFILEGDSLVVIMALQNPFII
jgi:hypothetical protein